MVTSPEPFGPLPALGDRLDSAKAKLRRANQEIRALKQSLQRFGRRDLYANGAKPYDPGVAYLPSRVIHFPARTIRSRYGPLNVAAYSREFFKSIALVITLAPKGDFSPQMLRWGILVGEIVHNIGSALENLIWELAQPLPPPPPPTANNKIRNQYRRHLGELGFPYTKVDKYWPDACDKYLFFVTDPVIRAVLERAQSFYAWKQAGTDPDTFPLEVIHELWNRDKHRTVNVAATGLQYQVITVSIPGLFPGVDNLPTQIMKLFPLRPLEGETEMAVIRVDFPKEVEFPHSGQMEMTVNVNPTYTLAILFGQGSSAEGLNVLDLLGRAHQLASQLIDKFE